MLSRCLFTAASAAIFCQTLSARTALEYFWNNDPGVGKGTVIYENAADPNGKEFTIDTSSLTPGFNMLGFRANINGRWSQTSFRMVAIDNHTTGSWGAEYFWNEDPGIGKATYLTLTENNGDGLISYTFDTDELHPGVNVFGVRIESNFGWSQTRTFIINVPYMADNTCVAEYFWDNDPGCGKGTPLSADVLSTGTLIELDLPTDGLKPGAHTLGIRSKSGQTWSTTCTNTVYVAGEKGPGCTYAEYFWGEDPGYGKGTPIDIKPGDEVSVDELTID
ncbi:MAG: hypothetical protein K2K23_02310, partial [Muribaculaceae bacterium]|nr:hypothetical protein [Muribaculaceae bacterium]